MSLTMFLREADGLRKRMYRACSHPRDAYRHLNLDLEAHHTIEEVGLPTNIYLSTCRNG